MRSLCVTGSNFDLRFVGHREERGLVMMATINWRSPRLLQISAADHREAGRYGSRRAFLAVVATAAFPQHTQFEYSRQNSTCKRSISTRTGPRSRL